MKKRNRPFHVVVTGPESCGKTTLANFISKKVSGRLVEEYAREYFHEHGSDYKRSDLRSIAFGQFSRQLAALNEDCAIVVSDTCLLTITIWEEWKYKSVDSFIEEWCGLQQVDLYLLCAPDLPWEEDALREAEFTREELFLIYEDRVKETGVPYKIISGDGQIRLDKAIEFIEIAKAHFEKE